MVLRTTSNRKGIDMKLKLLGLALLMGTGNFLLGSRGEEQLTFEQRMDRIAQTTTTRTTGEGTDWYSGDKKESGKAQQPGLYNKIKDIIEANTYGTFKQQQRGGTFALLNTKGEIAFKTQAISKNTTEDQSSYKVASNFATHAQMLIDDLKNTFMLCGVRKDCGEFLKDPKGFVADGAAGEALVSLLLDLNSRLKNQITSMPAYASGEKEYLTTLRKTLKETSDTLKEIANNYLGLTIS